MNGSLFGNSTISALSGTFPRNFPYHLFHFRKFRNFWSNSPLQKRERAGKECGCFRLFEKLRYSNERSIKFESLKQEKKYLEEENGKMIALQISPKIESLYGLGRQAKKL